jgi:hypothetical protein
MLDILLLGSVRNSISVALLGTFIQYLQNARGCESRGWRWFFSLRCFNLGFLCGTLELVYRWFRVPAELRQSKSVHLHAVVLTQIGMSSGCFLLSSCEFDE